MASFGEQLRQFAEKTEADLELVDRKFKLDLFSDVILRTRVDTGRMRGNWQVTTGAPARNELKRTRKRATTLAPADIAKIEAFSSTFLTNNVPYVRIWEERDGMVGGAIARARQILDEAVRDAGT